MPDPVTGAVVGTSLIGADSSNKAGKQAAQGQKEGLAASQTFANQAIGEAQDYFKIGQRSSQAGFQSALDFFKNTQPAKYEPMIQGNVAAQRVIGQGAQQANNAILGLPVDMSFANQQTAIQPNYSAIQGAQLPVLGGQQVRRRKLPQEQKNSGSSGGMVGNSLAGGILGNTLAGGMVGNSLVGSLGKKSLIGRLF